MRHLMMCVVGEVRRLRMTETCKGTCLGVKVSESAIKGLHVTKLLPPA